MKASKGIGFINKLNIVLPGNAFLTIYKSFVRHCLDYEDILYYQPHDVKANYRVSLSGTNKSKKQPSD